MWKHLTMNKKRVTNLNTFVDFVQSAPFEVVQTVYKTIIITPYKLFFTIILSGVIFHRDKGDMSIV